MLGPAGLPPAKDRSLTAVDASGCSDASGAARPSAYARKLAAATVACCCVLALAAALAAGALVKAGPKLTGGAEEAGAGEFGLSVALSADGSTALAGAPRDAALSGAAWVFARSGSGFTQQGGKLSAAGAAGEGSEEPCELEAGEERAGCGLGVSVALSADGNTALVGSPREHRQQGAARVFVRQGASWSEQGQPLTAGQEESVAGHFGRAVALSADGNTAVIGAPGDRGHHGAAWVFKREGTTWTLQGAKLTGAGQEGEGYFGTAVALSADGSTALIGAPGDAGYIGAAWTFTRSGTSWTQSGSKLTAGEEAAQARFGRSVALSAGGDHALIGGPRESAPCPAEPLTQCSNVGAAWAFGRSGSSWLQEAKLAATGESGAGEFGYAVALSADATKALIGAPYDRRRIGAAFVFARSGEAWSQAQGKLVGRGEQGYGAFGSDVALSGDGESGLVGAPHENGPCPNEAAGCPAIGAAWPFAEGPAEEVEEERGRKIEEKERPRSGGGSGRQTSGASGQGGGSLSSGAVLGFGPSAQGSCGIALASKNIAVQRRTRLAVRLLARGASACSGTLRLTSSRRIAHGRRTTRTIAAGRFSVTPGSVRVVTLSLNATGRALLRAGHGRLSAVLAIVRLAPLPVQAQSARVRLSSPRPRRAAARHR